MNNLTLNKSQVQYMSSKEIAEFTEKEHKQVLRNIRDMIENLAGVYEHPIDYKELFRDNGQLSEILLDKELTYTLVSGYSLVIRNRIVKRWLELENTPKIPQTYNEAILALASSIMENAKLERTLIEQKPKVDTYDAICQCENTFPVRDVSRFYDMRPSDLTNLLIEHDWVFRYKKGGKLSVKDKGFQQKLVVQKLFLATNSYGVDVVVKNVHITTKGILKIAKLLNIVQDDEFLENIKNSFNIE